MTEAHSHFPAVKEKMVIWLLCGLAAIHVFIFSAAFPFFNNVDEHLHFDLAVKYSHLNFPARLERISDESLRYEVVFGSLEFLYADGSLIPPPWTQPMSTVAPLLLQRAKDWKYVNDESSSPPLYYLIVGGWWRLWSACGFHDGFLLYLLRFLNVLFLGTLIWLGWHVARIVFPENIFIRLGVPILLASMPQSAFYSINNDVLSPVCFGAALICILQWMRTERPTAFLGAITGLAFAATFLTKITNVPLLLIAFAILAAKTFYDWWNSQLSRSILALASFAVCSLPLM
jgi:hypothetical protein